MPNTNKDERNELVPLRPKNQRTSRSLRHFWFSLRHALRWSQLKQRFHYQHIWAFTKRHWFAPTVIVLLAIIVYQNFLPFRQQQGGSANLSPVSADFASPLSEKSNSRKTKEQELPADLPGAGKRDKEELSQKFQQQYIQRFAKVAQDESKKYAVPASVTLGLAMLCSEFGTTDLALQYNNHFSFDCKNNVFNTDTELITKNENCYVKFPTAWASFRANSLLLSTAKYRELAKIAKGDVKVWASGLERLGYPNPAFSASNLLYIIDNYNLEKYD